MPEPALNVPAIGVESSRFTVPEPGHELTACLVAPRNTKKLLVAFTSILSAEDFTSDVIPDVLALGFVTLLGVSGGQGAEIVVILHIWQAEVE